MSAYGSIGFTRRDKTPKHWQKDYRLNPTAKKQIQELKSQHERLFKEFESLPIELSDEEYLVVQKELTKKLDELIEKEDKIRLQNPR